MNINWKRRFTKKNILIVLDLIITAFVTGFVLLLIEHAVDGYEISFRNLFRIIFRASDRMFFYGIMFALIGTAFLKKKNKK